MPIRCGISLALGAIIIPTIALFTVNPATAQYGERDDGRDPHYYCDDLARERADRYSQGDGVGNVLEGAAGGAITGAVIGAIAGNTGKGAGIGAVVGGFGRSKEKRNDKKAIYRREYDTCMRRNGR